MSKENTNAELSTSVGNDAKHIQIAFAPIPMNDWEMQRFVGTAKRLSKEALYEFDEHFG